MTGVSGSPWPFLALAWPLVLAVVAALPPVRGHAMRLLPLAPLPALWLALSGGGGRTEAPDLLLGMTLQASPAGALLLSMTAALWLAAGIYAQGYMAGARKPAVFAGFWCLTLSGNLGVFLAADAVTFYVAFATVSLAAYFLIVHDGSETALRAGRVYIVMVILGEVCLLAAVIIGVAAADSLAIADIRAALPDAPLGGVAAALLVAGFSIKAGLMPLHVWLPLAHPAAPTPASAVLSGAIVKAGVIGLMLFLAGNGGLAMALIAAGFFTAFAGALLGLTQNNPKAILAYSTISQMGLVIALIGAALQGKAGLGETALYAFHHGLAKGALFLSIGVVAASAGRWRGAALLLAILVALSVAGAPLTGGGLVKLAAKDGLSGISEIALTLSAVSTTLVLAWFVLRTARTDNEAGGRPGVLLAAPTFALAAAALLAPWILWSGWTALPTDYPMKGSSVWSASWPILIGLALVAAAGRSGARAPSLPEGDILVVIDRGSPALAGRFRALERTIPQARAVAGGWTRRAAAVIARAGDLAPVIEGHLRSGRYDGGLLVGLSLAIVLTGLAYAWG